MIIDDLNAVETELDDFLKGLVKEGKYFKSAPKEVKEPSRVQVFKQAIELGSEINDLNLSVKQCNDQIS